MAFNTEKYKIFKIWNDSAENQFQINTLADDDKIILSKITDLNNQHTVYNNIINLSSEWLAPNTRVANDLTITLFKQYTVEINGISSNLIPYIESKIVYRMGDSEISSPDDFDYTVLNMNSVFKIEEDIDGTGKNISYKSSIFLQDYSGLPEELQFKFYINIVNPIYYQST